MPDMPEFRWLFRAEPVRVIDGDTVVCLIDCGWGVWLHPGSDGAHIRLADINCPELGTAEGTAAAAFTAQWVTQAGTAQWPLLLETTRSDSRDKYSRYLATIWRTIDGRCLNADLLDAGLATPYPLVKGATP